MHFKIDEILDETVYESTVGHWLREKERMIVDLRCIVREGQVLDVVVFRSFSRRKLSETGSFLS